MNPLPYTWARAQRALLNIRPDGTTLTVSPRTPAWAIAEVQRRHGALRIMRVPDAELETKLAASYADTGDAASVVGAAENEIDLARLMQDIPEIEDLLETQDDAPVIRMINALFTQAARDGASDIHIEAFETHSVVRYRVDGTLRDVVSPRKALHAALISRIKIMANLDISEKRLPQDGRIALRVGGRPIDVRVSTLPTGHGERAVLRLLDKEAGRLELSRLGMDATLLKQIDRLIRQPHGIVLVTGPTGSGKTTTLYAALARLDSSTTNILTVEDPIEYDLPGISQTQVNAKINMSFAMALRAILRQDPDVIMIGEIRDLETAQIAVQASLTGHLVLATLHTNDSVSAVTRLTDMGVEPFLLSSSLLGVVAQRLVRRLCQECKEASIEPDGRTVYRPVGCPACSHTGYSGRTGIHELFTIDETQRRLIHEGTSEEDMRQAAAAAGMLNMRQDGERWIRSGVTSPEEVIRVTRGRLTMPSYRYEASDAIGKVERGLIDADSPRAARTQLRARGLTPLAVDSVAPQENAAAGAPRPLFGAKMSDSELAWTTRQLASLLSARLPLDAALTATAEQAERKHIREVLTTIRSDIRAGHRLADALATRPRDFPEIYRALIAAGEESGDLAQVMEKLADYIEERNTLRTKVLTAFIYPAVVACVSVGIVIFLLGYVVPQVVSAFSQARQELPLLTRVMLGLSDFVRSWGWLVGIGLAAAFTGWRMMLRAAPARLAWHSRLLRTPVAGRFILGLDAARFASTLAILTGSGVPLLRALDASRQTLGNDRLRASIDDATTRVREGVSLASALQVQKTFPPLLIHLTASGEKTGTLPDLLERAAQTLSREVERKAMAMTALLEPLMILLMGGFVLLIVLAVLMPIIEINQLVR